MTIPVKNGLFLGAAFFIGTIAFIVGSPSGYITYGTYPLFLIAVLIIVKTGLDIKNSQGGFAKFGELFGPILITVAIGYLIRMFAIYIAYNFINPEIIEIQKEMSVEAMESMSGLLGDDMMDKMYEEVDSMNPAGILELLQTYFVYLIGAGGIINAIVSLIIKKEKPLIDRV